MTETDEARTDRPDGPAPQGTGAAGELDLALHLRWMRGLARALVRDEAGAEDLVQDAAVAALRHEGVRPLRVRAWLGTLLRNRARDAARRAEAARAREAERARPEAIEDPNDLEQRAAMGAELGRRVLELDEPLRSTLLMRYWDDLPPRVIARRQGVPVATVKSRLARGLARMRRDLDVSRGGDRRAWVMAVLPLTRKTTPLAAVPAAGWIAMNAKLTAAACGVAALCAALLLARPDAAAEPDAEPASSAPSRGGGDGFVAGGAGRSAPELSRPDGSVGSRRAPDVSARQETPAVRNRVDAQVVDGSGRSLGGVKVRLEDEDSRGETDRTGRVELETGSRRASVVTDEPGAWVTVRPGFWSEGSGKAPLVVAAPVLRVGGSVLDEFGFAVAGARVEIAEPRGFAQRFEESLGTSTRRGWSEASDEDGRFLFAEAPGIEGSTIVVTAEGYLDARLEMPAASREDLTAVLRRPVNAPDSAVRGRVLRADGFPAANARVALGYEVVGTDVTGAFALDAARSGGADTMVAIEAGSQAVELRREGDASGPRKGWPEFVELRLGGPALEIRGVVVDEEGRGLAGARVWLDAPTSFGPIGVLPLFREGLAAGLLPPDQAVASIASLGALGAGESHGTAMPVGTPNAMLPWVATDAEGRFVLGGLEDEDYVLRVAGPALEYGGLTDPIAAGSSGVEIVMQTQERYERVRGRVVTAAGVPVPDVAITPWVTALSGDFPVLDGSSNVMRFFTAKGIRTDEDGAFEMTNVPKRHLQLFLGSSDINPGYSSVDEIVDPLDFVIVVRARVEVAIEIMDLSAGVDEVRAIDAAGARVDALRIYADGYSTIGTAPVEDGKTGVFALTTDAVALQLLANGALVETVEVRLVPGEVTRVTW